LIKTFGLGALKCLRTAVERAHGLAPARLLLGVGSPNPQALKRVREGVAAIRKGVTTRVIVAALGPKMCALAGEVADGVLFNWLTPEYARRSAELVRAGAKAAGRPMPRTYAYVRVALGPGAVDRLHDEGGRYAAIPAYAAHFERMGSKPIDTAIIPDRIEAATFVAAGALVGGPLRVEGVVLEHCEAAVRKIEETGAHVTIEKSALVVERRSRPRAIEVTTAPFPGFATDMQAQVMALLSLADGTSTITDTIYHDRFTHVPELVRLGADIRLENNVAIVRGVEKLSGCPVMATDLRASAALVLAALVAEGETHISRIYHLDRGYERLDEKLAAAGARITRIRE